MVIIIITVMIVVIVIMLIIAIIVIIVIMAKLVICNDGRLSDIPDGAAGTEHLSCGL